MSGCDLPTVFQLYPMLDPIGEELLRPHVNLITASAQDFGTLIEEGRDAQVLVGRAPGRVTPEVLSEMKQLDYICANGSGVDWVDIAWARSNNVPIAHNAGIAPGPVAEYVFGALISHRKRLRFVEDYVRRGDPFNDRAVLCGDEISGTNLGVIGFGHIGREVGRIGRAAFDMTVRFYDPYVDAATIPDGVERVDDLGDLFAISDVLTLHVPLLPETVGLIDATVLQRAKPDSTLVNVARGPVVNQADLVAALRDGPLGGLVTDVFDPEPPTPDDPLFSLPNVLATPHIAGLTNASRYRLSSALAENVLTVLRGERPAHLVNPECWPGRASSR